MKRKRRKASEIGKLRKNLEEIVTKEGRITLTDLTRLYGRSIGLRDTLSDKNLAKRQLDILARSGAIRFLRDGRDLVAAAKAKPKLVAPAPTPAPPAEPTPKPEPAKTPVEGGESQPNLEWEAVRAYAQHVSALAEALHQQVETLVKMVEGGGNGPK